jgi:hypothetical protein
VNFGPLLLRNRLVVLAAICLILLVAMCCIDYATYRWTVLAHYRASSFYGIECSSGEVLFTRGRNIPISPSAPASAGLNAKEGSAGSYYRAMLAGTCPNNWEQIPEYPLSVPAELILPSDPVPGKPTFWGNCLAFHTVRDNGRVWSRIVIQLWPLLTLAATSTGFALLLCVRRRLIDNQRVRRARNGACIECGYDVRANSGRCPECGHTTPHSSASPGASNPASNVRFKTSH